MKTKSISPVSVFRKRSPFARFAADTSGTASVEFVMWFPIVIVLFALIVNVSVLFYSQNEVLRTIQDANRSLSIGRFDTVTQTEDFVEAQLEGLLPNAQATSTITAGIVTTVVTYPASDLLLFTLFNNFNSLTITSKADHLIEDYS